VDLGDAGLLLVAVLLAVWGFATWQGRLKGRSKPA
jgi:high-affinity nickel-transport protein